MSPARVSGAPDVGKSTIAKELADLAEGRNADPFAWLGPHRSNGKSWLLRVMAPGAVNVALIAADGHVLAEAKPETGGLFVACIGTEPAANYRWRIEWPSHTEVQADAYAFGPVMEESDLLRFRDGGLLRPGHVLGSHSMRMNGEAGVHFAVWAPNASRVSVVGDFNQWNGLRHPMRLRHTAGVWEIFIPGVRAGACYKYELLDRHGALLPLKADPYARQAELPPASGSVVAHDKSIVWHDAHWLARRVKLSFDAMPLSIYEVHALSWQHDESGHSFDWDALAVRLVPYVQSLGFTHIELLPVSEHPFGGSWGYQPVGLYAPTARMGSPESFARFVDSCHVAGIGVIVDWVSAHFPEDAHGLARFDGTALYEHADPREGFHQDWQTSIFNYGRGEVRNYLIGSAMEWIERFHIDGLRVDAVASMLYRDYSRSDGEWIPNAYGGRENLEAVSFLRELNQQLADHAPGVMVIAEESTAWKGVSSPVAAGGLGFSHKWNMGWMHDTLTFMQRDPIHRQYHSGDITFGLDYAWSERFVLPLSHDEVVHGKGSLLARMPGDDWQRFANLRAYFGFMWAHPGKKLLFMGGEFAQWREWNHDTSLDWHVLNEMAHRGVQRLVGDLNGLLHVEPSLHRNDRTPSGFAWVSCDVEHGVYAFLRLAEDSPPLLAVCNFTPEPRHDYRLGVPQAGQWLEVCNTDSAFYGGSNVGNGGAIHSQAVPQHGHANSLELVLPPLATLLLRPGCL